MAGPLDTRTTAQMDADNKAYLKAVKQNEDADKRAAEKRDAAIIKTLKEQNKLTEETFRTARAQEQVSNAATKGLDLVKGKVTEFGKGLVGGVVAGLGGAFLGGGIGSIVQQLFAPPSPEAIAAMARAGDEYEVFGLKVGKAARDLLESQRQIALSTEATKGFISVIESITHGKELELLREQLRIAEEQAATGWSAAAEAVKRIRTEIANLVDPTIKTGIEDLYKTLFGGTAKNFIAVIENNTKLIEQQKKWAEENKQLQKSLDSLRGSLDPLVAAQQRYAAAKELIDKNYSRGLINAAEERQLNHDIAQSLYEIEKAARAAAAAKAGVPQGGIPAGGLPGGDQGGGTNARDEANADAAMARRRRERAAEIDENKTQEDLDKLTAAFGASSPFMKVDLITQGFDALTTSAGAAFDALISGSESAGAAFAKALGGMLRADAVQAGIQALKEGAWALGSLAFGDAKGAALHAASAAQWAVTAAAAGAGAALLGAGGGGASAGAGGSGAASAGGGSAGGYYGSGAGGDPNGNRERIVVVGDSNGSSSPRFEAAKARRYAALGGSSNDRVRYE